MQISVVVPTYKRPELLKNCLKALLQQTFNAGEYEIIVVSDGPDLPTQVLTQNMRQINPQLQFIALDKNKGPAAARNAGWLAARGKIIAFTDDDCLPDKNWLREIAGFINPNQEEAVSGRVIVPRSSKPTDYELNTAGLETAEFVTANCACTKKALFTTGGFDERFRMAWREDSDLHFKLIHQQIPITYLTNAIVVHPVREPKWGISLKEQKKTLFNVLLYQKYPGMYRQRIQPTPPILYYAIITAFLALLIGGINDTAPLFGSGLILWIILTLHFIIKRLRHTSRSPGHVAEMVLTSFFIPFLSIYWQWYGAIRYRVFFI